MYIEQYDEVRIYCYADNKTPLKPISIIPCTHRQIAHLVSSLSVGKERKNGFIKTQRSYYNKRAHTYVYGFLNW